MNDKSKGRKGNKEAKKRKQVRAPAPPAGTLPPTLPPAKTPRHRS